MDSYLDLLVDSLECLSKSIVHHKKTQPQRTCGLDKYRRASYPSVAAAVGNWADLLRFWALAQ